MKKLSLFQKILLVIIIVALILVAIGSFILDFRNFFNTSITSIISVFIALYLSFYLTQQLNDKREQIRHMEMMVMDIREIINEEAFFQVDDENQRKKATLLHRRGSNKIDLLEKRLVEKELHEEVVRLKDKFQEARTFYGDHMNDAEYMKKSETEILRYRESIETCCDRILMMLY